MSFPSLKSQNITPLFLIENVSSVVYGIHMYASLFIQMGMVIKKYLDLFSDSSLDE